MENPHAVQGLSHLDEVERAHGISASPTIAAALTRLVLTPLAHACWGALLGYALTTPVPNRWLRSLLVLASLLLASTLHGLYDDAASFANPLGVGALLATSFGITLLLLAHSDGERAPAEQMA
jgi:RsiW-degrading membrane proteinase PrsW (M82 family)